jgi:hypothetical protein
MARNISLIESKPLKCDIRGMTARLPNDRIWSAFGHRLRYLAYCDVSVMLI